MILGFAGPAQIGKTTSANFLRDEKGFQVLSFARGVKEECISFLELFNVKYKPENLFGTVHEKQELLTLHHYQWVIKQMPEFLDFVTKANKIDLSCTHLYFTGRELMQWWGTDYRRAQDVDYWVKRLLRDAIELDKMGVDCTVDDVRFPSEVQALQEVGGKVCYIIRKNRPEITGAVHESETALNGFTGFDKHIVNNGTLGMLKNRVIDWSDSLVPA